MAQIVDKLHYRFYIVGRGCTKQLRALLFNAGHQQTTRADIDSDAAIFYAKDEESSVAPLLYGAKAIAGVKMNLDLDRRWIEEYHNLGHTFPKIGIGRGAHFLNIMSGGSVWQKADNHTLPHDLKFFDTGELIQAPSSHSQLMTCGKHGTVVATANVSTKVEDDKDVINCSNPWSDDEVIYYEHTNSLCIEPHPEIQGYSAFSKKIVEIVETAISPS